ncbi:MAG: GMC family oxidoreductase [Solirubrobacteraceae bacterium]
MLRPRVPSPRRKAAPVQVDHIVVGAGSAGCAVAARLAEDPSRSVLLVEAGGSDLNVGVRAPVAFGSQFRGRGDWGFESEPEPSLDGRRIFEPRGKVLGGTSSMNAMVWVRGAASDYDGWDLDGWSWEECRAVFERIERRHDLHGPRASGGPVRLSTLRSPDDLSERFIRATEATGIARRGDLTAGEREGVGYPATTTWNGRRWNAARAYLGHRPPNLHVATGSHASRIVLQDGRAVGVELLRRGRRTIVRSRGDIVLSAGAFGTPHLLQLSGIGDPEHLREVGISPTVDAPRVGLGLAEHALAAMNWELADGHPGLSDAANPKWLAPWLVAGRGPLASNVIEAVAHLRSRADLDAPDLQLVMGPIFFWQHGAVEHPRPAMVIGPSYWEPKSRGSVLARSADPLEAPAIRLNMLEHRDDVEALTRGVRIAREIVAQQPLSDAVRAELHPGPEVESDAQIEAWLRSNAEHTYHPACSAAMGADDDAVLDERLRVRGVDGLRVADASALPRITHANTHAPATLLGERCARFVLDLPVPR